MAHEEQVVMSDAEEEEEAKLLKPKKKRRRQSEISDESKAAKKQKRKAFRFQGIQVYLTYPKCYLTLDQVTEAINARYPIVKQARCKEDHADGTPHMHLYFNFAKPIDSIDPRIFDIEAYHPNISRVGNKASLERVYDYIVKDGKFDEKGEFHWFTSRKNFTKEKKDFDAYMTYVKRRGKADPYPITLPMGMKIYKPLPSTKKCNYYLVGKTGIGKSEWVEREFKGKRICKITPDNLYPFENYNGQEVLLADDWCPTLKQLVHASGCYNTETNVPGNTRYGSVQWKEGQRHTIIILKHDLPEFANPEHPGYEAFIARFHIIDLDEQAKLEKLEIQPW